MFLFRSILNICAQQYQSRSLDVVAWFDIAGVFSYGPLPLTETCATKNDQYRHIYMFRETQTFRETLEKQSKNKFVEYYQHNDKEKNIKAYYRPIWSTEPENRDIVNVI